LLKYLEIANIKLQYLQGRGTLGWHGPPDQLDCHHDGMPQGPRNITG